MTLGVHAVEEGVIQRERLETRAPEATAEDSADHDEEPDTEDGSALADSEPAAPSGASGFIEEGFESAT